MIATSETDSLFTGLASKYPLSAITLCMGELRYQQDMIKQGCIHRVVSDKCTREYNPDIGKVSSIKDIPLEDRVGVTRYVIPSEYNGCQLDNLIPLKNFKKHDCSASYDWESGILEVEDTETKEGYQWIQGKELAAIICNDNQVIEWMSLSQRNLTPWSSNQETHVPGRLEK